MMRNLLVASLAIMAVASLASAQASGKYYFSLDLGGDLDLSDPGGAGAMDCGDIYVENVPTLVKDDDGPAKYLGHPFAAGGAPQPTSAQVGNCGVQSYVCFFDLDAEDQIAMEVYQPTSLVIPQTGVGGVHVNPMRIDFSYEDDGVAGWAVGGDVPTAVAPAHGGAVPKDEVMIDAGPFGVWSPATITGVRDEIALGLAANPPGEQYDDDVDALDVEEHRYFYWSPDHEASMGLDPGSIYMTDLNTAGANQSKVLDDVANIGVLEDTDLDAWEFCAVTHDVYLQLFGVDPGATVLIGLFSVDGDDTDTVGVDESGGLNPNQIYATNLIGTSVGLAIYGEDVDALTVPEPATLVLLGIGAVAMVCRRRK